MKSKLNFRFCYKWGDKENPYSTIEISKSAYAFWIALDRANQEIRDSGRNPEDADLTYYEIKDVD